MPGAGLGKVSCPKGTREWWKVVGKVSDRIRLFWKITLTVNEDGWDRWARVRKAGLEGLAAVVEEVMLAWTRAETVVGRAKR